MGFPKKVGISVLRLYAADGSLTMFSTPARLALVVPLLQPFSHSNRLPHRWAASVLGSIARYQVLHNIMP